MCVPVCVYSEPGSAERQADILREEGVQVTTDSMGEMYVDFGRYGWFPERLPSEEDDDEGEEGEGDSTDGDDDGHAEDADANRTRRR